MTNLIRKNPGAIVTNTPQDGQHRLQKTDMKHGLRKLQMTEMTRALRHAAGTCLTFGVPINGTQARVTETSHLRLAPIIRLAALYFTYGHLPL